MSRITISTTLHAKEALYLDALGLLLAGLINTFLALIVAGLVLGPGTPSAQPDLAARSLWIAAHPVRWQAGWLFWFAVTLSFAWSYYALGRNLGGAPPWRHLAIAVALIAAAVDIVGVLVNLVVIPFLAEMHTTVPADAAQTLLVIFHAQERLAYALTNVAAFGLYSLAGILLLPACFATPNYPRSLAWLGVAEWSIAALATALLVLAPAFSSIPLLISFFLYAPWVWGSAWWLLRQPGNPK